MKQQFWDRFCLFYIGSWLIVHLFRWMDNPILYVNSWLTDFVFLPLVFHIGHFVTTSFYFKNKVKFRYNLATLLLAATYAAIIMEVVAPRFSARYTGDVWDIVMYYLGTLFYYYVHQKHYTSSKTWTTQHILLD